MEFHELLERIGVDAPATVARLGGMESILRRFILKFPQDPTFSALALAVNDFWADELRKALGQEVTSGGDSTNGNAGNSSSSTTVTDEMLRTWELQMIGRIN